MNQIVVAILATIAAVSMLLAFTPRCVGLHAGGTILLLCTSAGFFAALIAYCWIVSFNG